MKKKLLIFILVSQIVSLLAGCSKKDNDTDKTKKEVSRQQPEQQVDISLKRQTLDKEIYVSFPSMKDYLFDKANLISQEKFLNEEQRAIHTMTSAICIFETSEPLESVNDFYKTLFPEDKFKVSYKNKKIRAFFCSQLLTDGINGLAYVISVKSYNPSLNFDSEVIESQIQVIKGQILQYEKIKAIQENKLSQNIAPEKTYQALQDCVKRIRDLKTQATALQNRSSVIEITLNYIMPSVPQPEISDND